VRRWQAANKDRVVSSRNRSYQRNREAIIVRSRTYYRTHREDQCEKARIRNRRNGYHCDQELKREATARRRARIRGNQVERISRRAVYERDQGRCYLCGKAVEPDHWHLEHIVPVARGGSHCYGNVAVACPECNWRKGCRPLAKES
jgi:5-methylcytosine-specific restriction endonuclease McrA